MPQAENTEAPAGTTTFLTPSSAASATPCMPPPPPKATSVKSRGSWPRLSETSFSALTMLLLAMRMMPRAASSASTPSFSPTAVDAPLRRLHVGGDLAAAEIVLVDAAEPEIGVGGGGLGAAAAIGGGAGHRAGRLRADMQLAEIVDPGDRAAAIADLDQVDHRHHDRIAGRGAVALDPVVGLDLDLAVLDQRAFCGGAADVEREHVRLADQLAELGRTPEAGGRAGFDHGDRDLRDRFQRSRRRSSTA